MRYQTCLFILTMCLAILFSASAAIAIGGTQAPSGFDTSSSANINHQLLSKITLWNSLNVSNKPTKFTIDGEDTFDSFNSGSFVENNQFFNFKTPGPRSKNLSTQKLSLKQLIHQQHLQGPASSKQTFPEEGFRVSPYLLLSQIQMSSQPPPFWKERTNKQLRGKATEKIYWMGGSLSGSLFGPLNLQVNSLYGTNNFQEDKNYYNSWLTDFGLEYEIETLTPVFHVFYSSESQDKNFLQGENLLSFDLQDKTKSLPQKTPSLPSESGSQFSKKNIGIQLGAKDLNLLNRLNNSFNLFYAKNIYSNQYEDHNNTSRPDHNESIQETRIQSMWEVDVSSYYNLYENLSVGLYFSYTSSYPQDENEMESTSTSEIHSDLNFEF